MKGNPQWLENSTLKHMFEIFELKDKQRVESKEKPKEISKLQVRPLEKNPRRHNLFLPEFIPFNTLATETSSRPAFITRVATHSVYF